MTEAKLVVAVDATQVDRGTKSLDDLAQSGKAAETSTAALTKATDTLANAAKAAAAALGLYKLSEMVKDATMLAARYETLGIVMHKAGENAGYTKSQMDAYSVALQKSGISMLQSRESLTQLATAHIDLAKAAEIGRAAQNLAVVAGVNSSDAMASMIHGIKSGQTEVLRTLGINVNFEESYKSLARQLKVNVNDLSNQQKEMARTNIVIAESAAYNGIYEASMTTAGKAMGSMTRYWQDFQVKVGESFLPALSTEIFTLIDALKFAAAHVIEITVVLKGLVVAGSAYGALNIANKVYEAGAAFVSNAIAVNAARNAQILAAKTELELATARLAEMRATVLASEGVVQLELVTNGLIPVQQRAIAAEEALAAARAGGASASKLASGALGLVGGPIGAITIAIGLAASAWSYFSAKSEEAAATAELTAESLKSTAKKMTEEIDKQNIALEKRIKLMEQTNVRQAKASAPELDALAAINDTMNQLKKAMESVNTEASKATLLKLIKNYNDEYNITLKSVQRHTELNKELAKLEQEPARQKKEEEKQKKIKESIDGLEKEAKTAGMTAAQIKIYDAAMLGMNKTQLEHAKNLIESAAAADAAAKAESNHGKSLEKVNKELQSMTDAAQKSLIKTDMASAFGQAGSAIDKMTNSFSKFIAAQEASSKLAEKIAEKAALGANVDAENSILKQKRMADEIDMYATLANVSSSLFEKNSKEAKALHSLEQGFRIMQLAMSIAAMTQNATETTQSVAGSGAKAAASTTAGAAKAFEQMGVWGFVGAAAIIAYMASRGVSGGGGSGGMGMDAQAIAKEGRGLAIQEQTALGNTGAAQSMTRFDELAALNAVNRAVQLRIWALQDEAKINADLAKKREGYQNQYIKLLELSGRSEEALAATRALELSKMDSSAQALQKLIYGFEDSAKSIATLTSAISTAQGAIQTLRDTAKSIRDFATGLYLGAQAPYAGNAAQLRRNFESTNTMAGTGDVGAIGSLQSSATDYLTAARAGSVNAVDYARQVAFVANSLNKTAGAIDSTATVAEKQLNATISANSSLSSIVKNTGTTTNILQDLLVSMGAVATAVTNNLASPPPSSSVVDKAIVGANTSADQAAQESKDRAAKKAAALANFNQLFSAYQARLASLSPMELAMEPANGAALRAAIDAAKAYYDSLPSFAVGGNHLGGLRIVGENGPELEATGPSRITNTNSLMDALRNPQQNSEAIVSELRRVTDELKSARMELAEIRRTNYEMNRTADKWDIDGLPDVRTA